MAFGASIQPLYVRSPGAVTTKRRHRRRKTPGEPTSLRQATRSRPSLRYTDFHQGSFIFVPPDVVSWRTLSPSFSSVTDAAVRYDYNLANGFNGLAEVSRLSRASDAHLALHESRISGSVGARKFDLLKPFRAAAFAGFATREWRYADDE